MEFEQKYISLKNEIEHQGKKMKKLHLVMHKNPGEDSSVGGLRHISTNHLSFRNTCMVINCCDVINVPILTCDSWVQFRSNDENSRLISVSHEQKHINIAIETLRLM